MVNTNNPKLSSRICVKNVHDKVKPAECGLCEVWIRIYPIVHGLFYVCCSWGRVKIRVLLKKNEINFK